jgi:hypothetical protein
MSSPDIGPGGVCGGADTIEEGVVATMGAGPKGNEFFKGGETVLFGLVPDG